MNKNQISLSVENQAEKSLWRDLTEQEQEMLGGSGYTTDWFRYFTALVNYNWHYGGGQQKFINNVKQNGLGVIDNRVNAILGNLSRYW